MTTPVAQWRTDVTAKLDQILALLEPAPPPPLAPMLIGAATTDSTGAPSEASFEALEAKVGKMGVRRTYETSIPATFQGSHAGSDVGVRASWVSVKFDWAAMARGDLDGLVTPYLLSVPAGHQLMLTPAHEPENDGGDPKAYVAAVRHFYTLVKAVRPDILVGPIFIGWTFDPHNSRTTQAAYADPLGGAMDFAGIDTYQGYRWPPIGAPLKWDPVPLAQFTAFIAWCATLKIPPALGETACACDPTGPYDVAAKVDFINHMIGTADTAGALAFCWFNTNVNHDMDPSQLVDAQPESVEAWATQAAAHTTAQ